MVLSPIASNEKYCGHMVKGKIGTLATTYVGEVGRKSIPI